MRKRLGYPRELAGELVVLPRRILEKRPARLKLRIRRLALGSSGLGPECARRENEFLAGELRALVGRALRRERSPR
jgi:hypothetical protein